MEVTGQCFPYGCGNGAKDKYIFDSYDWLGNLLSQSDATALTIGYTYTSANQIASVTGPDYTGAPPALVTNVVNGPFGPVSWTLGNGLTGVNMYDGLGNRDGSWVCNNGSTQNYCSGPGQVYGWVAEPNKEGTQLAESWDNVEGHWVYGRDDFNRLISANRNSGQQAFSYTYDRWGNRWAQTVTAGSGGSWSASFNTANNQIVGYNYDAAGNVTSDGTHSYSYDAEGNLTQVDGGSTATYTYDALNHRIRVGTPVMTVDFTYDFAGRRVTVWKEAADFGILARIYWGSSSAPLAYHGLDGTEYFSHHDWLGTERMRTNYQGNLAGTYSSLPFGDGYSATGLPYGEGYSSNGLDDDPYRFAGLDKDYYGSSDSGTDHAQYRQYSDLAGSWLSPDPYSGSYDFTNPQSLNRYSYVMNNPLTFNDPTGLDDCSQPSYDGNPCIYQNPGGIGTGGASGSATGDLLGILIDLGEAFYDLFGGGAPGFHGSLLPRPSTPQVVLSNGNAFTCGAAAAQKVSIAGGLNALGVGSNGGVGGFLTNALGGNVFSGAMGFSQEVVL
jgi:RHS repeat-associated protein